MALKTIELAHNSAMYDKGTEMTNYFTFLIEYVIVDDSGMRN
jgi:hypothetical protein